MSALPDPAHPIGHVRGSLPTPLSSFIGRDAEVARARETLTDPSVRLLTLTGPGGVGKTRLAIEVARDAAPEFPDGVVFVPVADVTEPAGVLPAIATALGVRDEVGKPLPLRLRQRLSERAILLLLDNLEQVVACGPLLTDLLAECPGPALLVTSRVRLNVNGEYVSPVEPLALPLPDEARTEALLAYSAIALFAQRAAQVRPGFALTDGNAAAVVRICTRLDGIPLAIELAAARSNILSPAALLARIEGTISPVGGGSALRVLVGGAADLPARQRTLRDAIAWSIDLLEAADQALLCRLGVVAGGFSIESAAAVATIDGPLPDHLETLDRLSRLVEAGLLRQAPDDVDREGEPRFRLYETVREFALVRLTETGALDAVRDAHAVWCLSLAEADADTDPERDKTGAAGARRLEPEHDNLRSALAWLLDGRDPARGLRLAAALWPFWYARGHVEEGRRWLERALAVATDVASDVRARALRGAATLAFNAGDYSAAEPWFRASETMYRALGNETGVAAAAAGLGLVARERGDLTAAAAWFESALDIYRAAGDEARAAGQLDNLGVVARRRGDLERARTLHERALAIQRAVGDRVAVAKTLQGLAGIATRTGDRETATAYLLDARLVARQEGHRSSEAYALNNLANIAADGGDIEQAAAWFEEALTLFRQIGEDAGVSLVLHNLASTLHEIGDDARAVPLLRESLLLDHRLGRRTMIAETVRVVARVAVRAGRLEQATRLIAAAARLEVGPLPESPVASLVDNETVMELAGALGVELFNHAWRDGFAMTEEQALAEALAVTAAPEGSQWPRIVPPATPSAVAMPTAAVEAGLSVREIEVLRLIAEGNTNREIADRLFIAPRTASTHVTNILGKLGVDRRSAATAWAFQHGIVAVRDDVGMGSSR